MPWKHAAAIGGAMAISIGVKADATQLQGYAVVLSLLPMPAKAPGQFTSSDMLQPV